MKPEVSSVLIAGHGYLGSALAESLSRSGTPLIALNRTEERGSGDRPCPVYSCDISSPESVAALAGRIGPPDTIIHCASSGRGGPADYRSVFVEGSRSLQQQFPEARIFLTSSTSVYAQTDGSVVTEDSTAEPQRETGQLLRQAEDSVLVTGGTVLRLAGIYGPGRSVHLQRMLNGTAFIETGDVSRFLNQIHRDDAVSAIQHLMSEERRTSIAGQIYNVADGNPITQRICYETLSDLLDLPLPPERAPDRTRKRAWTHKRVSIDKLQATGWLPRFEDLFAAVKTDSRLIRSIKNQPGSSN